MKDQKPADTLDDIELLPDPMGRLERAAKAVFAQQRGRTPPIKGAKRQPPAKSKRRRP